jgi:molecular chaperone DnaK
VISLVRKPAAAIWAHGYAQDPERMVLLYDIGSTRTSVSIVLVDDDARVDDMRVFEWLADASLPMGGRDFDRRIADHLMAVYEEKTGVDIAAHPSALKDLVHEAEAAKRRLSSDDSTEVFFQWPEDGRTFSEILTRTKFESLVSDLIDQTTELVERTLKDTQAWATEDARGLRKEEVHDVRVVRNMLCHTSPSHSLQIILAGGSSNIPLIQQRLTELFDKPPRLDVAPEEVVVHGAAVLGRTAKGRGERTHDEL